MSAGSGTSPVFSAVVVRSIAQDVIARINTKAEDGRLVRLEQLLDIADACSIAMDALIASGGSLSDVASLAEPLISELDPHLLDKPEWNNAQRITLVTEACHLRRYARYGTAEFLSFVEVVRDRSNSMYEQEAAVHW